MTTMTNMNELFNIGDTIYGFCNGYFGRDDYATKICIMVNPKYAIFHYLDGEFKGEGIVLNNPDRLNKETVAEWKQEN